MLSGVESRYRSIPLHRVYSHLCILGLAFIPSTSLISSRVPSISLSIKSYITVFLHQVSYAYPILCVRQVLCCYRIFYCPCLTKSWTILSELLCVFLPCGDISNTSARSNLRHTSEASVSCRPSLILLTVPCRKGLGLWWLAEDGGLNGTLWGKDGFHL